MRLLLQFGRITLIDLRLLSVDEPEEILLIEEEDGDIDRRLRGDEN